MIFQCDTATYNNNIRIRHSVKAFWTNFVNIFYGFEQIYVYDRCERDIFVGKNPNISFLFIFQLRNYFPLLLFYILTSVNIITHFEINFLGRNARGAHRLTFAWNWFCLSWSRFCLYLGCSTWGTRRFGTTYRFWTTVFVYYRIRSICAVYTVLWT